MKSGISAAMFEQVYEVIRERKQSSPEKSYVASLMTKGTDAILKKIGEESAEVIIAAKTKTEMSKFMKSRTSVFTCSS